MTGAEWGFIEEFPTDSGAFIQPRIIKHQLYTKRCLYIVNENNGGGDIRQRKAIPRKTLPVQS